MPFTPSPSFTTRPTLTGSFGMAASTHWLATASAQAVLERGGNAFDAAVAGAFVLHIVEPHLNGPGGDLVGIFATADDPRPRVLMGQGPAPEGATIERYRAEGLDLVPGAGGLAAAIPGGVGARLGACGRWPAAPSRSGDWGAGRRAGFPRRLRARRSRAGAGGRGDDPPGGAPLPRGGDQLGPPVDAGGNTPGAGRRGAQPG